MLGFLSSFHGCFRLVELSNNPSISRVLTHDFRVSFSNLKMSTFFRRVSTVKSLTENLLSVGLRSSFHLYLQHGQLSKIVCINPGHTKKSYLSIPKLKNVDIFPLSDDYEFFNRK